MGTVENPMVIGADAEYGRHCDLAERLDSKTEYELDKLLAGDGSYVEEAISENAEVLRVKLAELTAHPERAEEIADTLNRMIATYLEPMAKREAERSAMWGDA